MSINVERDTKMKDQELVQTDDIQEKIIPINASIKSRRYLTEDEKNLIGDIRAGLKRKYKLFCWSMRGIIALQANNDRYSELINRFEIFRRRYIYRSVKRPTCIILEQDKTNFSILDLRKEPIDKQKEFVKNIASAEAREIYNPEENSPLKVRVLVMGEDRIVVFMKVYTHLNIPMSPFDMRRFIFFNMRMDSESDFSIDEEKIENANQEILNKCFEYWRNTLDIIDKPVIIPFSNSNSEDKSVFYTVRKGINDELFRKIIDYRDKKGYSLEQIFIYEFGQFFGESSEIKIPLFAIRMPGSFMQMMPCKVDLSIPISDSYDDINNQIEKYHKYNQCNFDDAMNEAGIDIPKYFNVLFGFENENDSERRVTDVLQSINGVNVSEVSSRLEIVISYSKSGIVISYSYDSAVVSEYVVNMIQESLEKGIEERIASNSQFSWKAYVADSKSREEQLVKLDIAQKSLYIKEADFVKSENPEDFIKLSSSGKYGNYVTEDIILGADSVISSIGIVLSGHIEERQKNIDGILKTVSIYKAGYILGIESVAGIARCPFEYVAADDVKVLWLDSNTVMEIMREYPSCYEVILKRAVLETHRVKKLWVLD